MYVRSARIGRFPHIYVRRTRFRRRTPFRAPALPSARRTPLRPSPSLPPSSYLMPVALPSARRTPFRHRPPFRPSPVAMPSARRPPFRPSPSLLPVTLPSSRHPPFLPLPSQPPVALPSPHRTPFRPLPPFVTPRSLLLIALPLFPSQSPYLSPLIDHHCRHPSLLPSQLVWISHAPFPTRTHPA
ncbi:unnamed protein product [Closterium sp. NIES-64]|nr:unnamed protein product [Closterium sp. NIES-64]